METALLVSNGLLWCVVLALVAMVIALARQVGVLFERVAPMGALVTDSGPKVGEPAPALALRTIDHASLQLPGATGTSTLVPVAPEIGRAHV